MMIPAVLLAAAIQAATPWTVTEAPFRRTLALSNPGAESLPAGTVVAIRMAKADFRLDRDLVPSALPIAAFHGDRPIASVVRHDEKEDRIQILIPLAAEIAAGKSDARYVLYAGRPAGHPGPATLFRWFQDFSEGASPFPGDEAMSAEPSGGRLRISRVAATATDIAPGRLVLPVALPAPGFALSVELHAAPADQERIEAGVRIDLAEDVVADAAVARRVVALVEQLGAEEFQDREEAAIALIGIGRPAIAKVQDAAAASDPEIRWRAAHVLARLRVEFPPPQIQAVARFEGSGTRFITSIGKVRSEVASGASIPRVTLRIERDRDGDVTVRWNGTRATRGSLPGPVREAALIAFHPPAAGTAGLSFDDLAVGIDPFGEESVDVALGSVQERK